jgi:hypothetical protein
MHASEDRLPPFTDYFSPMLSMQDITKTGSDHAKLKERVRAVPRLSSGFRSPLEELRDLVPTGPPREQVVYTCDPDLILEEFCKEAWNREYDEAQDLMGEFNRKLSAAIKLNSELSDKGIFQEATSASFTSP